MYWACVDGAPAVWHIGLVTKHLKPGRRDQYTHNACLDSERVNRGVTLTAVEHAAGIWFPIALADADSQNFCHSASV
eukprot:4323403-Pleurochrysis_carterae.AAC.1